MLDGGGRIDLLIVDFAMPEMNGAELLRRVRKLRPGLPALMVTGYVKDRASLDEVEVEVFCASRSRSPCSAHGSATCSA